MDETTITALVSSFTDNINSMKTPVITIMGAGIIFTAIFGVYKLGKRAFNKSTS